MKITIGNQYDAELILVSKDLVPAAYGDIVEQLKGKNLFKGEEGEVYSYVNLLHTARYGKIKYYRPMKKQKSILY